jgi:hypothetical protein
MMTEAVDEEEQAEWNYQQQNEEEEAKEEEKDQTERQLPRRLMKQLRSHSQEGQAEDSKTKEQQKGSR